jgi:hypothetical protein
LCKSSVLTHFASADAVARSSAILKTQRPKGRKEPPARKVRGTGARKALFKSQAAAEQETSA